MKKLLPLALALLTTTAFAQDIQFDDLSKDDVENVSREFAGNFAHTGVSAPETNGMWGVEFGLVAGQAKTPDLKDVIDASGGDGSQFDTIYHAGAQARVHLWQAFAEVVILPERDIEEVSVSNNSIEIGWNLGGTFHWPVDVAIAASRTNSEINFKQEISGVDNKINLETQTTMYWIGVSKTFWLVTPYVKFGKANAEADLKSDSNILTYSASTKESVDVDGGYYALGANLELGFIKFGAEVSKVMDVSRASGKISFDF